MSGGKRRKDLLIKNIRELRNLLINGQQVGDLKGIDDKVSEILKICDACSDMGQVAEWLEPNICRPLDLVRNSRLQDDPALAPSRMQAVLQPIAERLNRFLEGYPEEALPTMTRCAAEELTKPILDERVGYLTGQPPQVRVLPKEQVQGELPEDAARRLYDQVAIWQMNAREDAGAIVVDFSGPGAHGCVNRGPHLSAADLNTVASVGPIGAVMVEKLRAWSVAAHADECGPTDALGFLRTLADHGEAEALRRWPAPVIPARDPAARPGLGALRAKHPELLAKPGPCAVLRVLLADPEKLWSARALAVDDALRDALPAGKADARSVGRWLTELHGAGLACAEGSRTAKRWRLGAA